VTGGATLRVFSVAGALLAVGAGAPPAGAPAGTDAVQSGPARIVARPDMLVSRDGDFPHVELQVSANPRDAKNLVGGAITYTRPKGGMACRAYATDDGGRTWSASEFAEQVKWGGGDPYTAFTPRGTAVFCALTMAKDEKDSMRAFLHVWRSEDGGRTWGEPADLGYSYDYQKMTADQTNGPYSGRLYIAALHGYPEYLVSVFRSTDDGRTWIGPVQAVSGGGTKGVGAVNVFVLSDGTLVVPIVEYEFLPDKVQKKGKVWRPMSIVTSPDGGVTFSPQRKAPAVLWDMDDPDARRAAGNPQFAADVRTKEYRDRIYMVWNDYRHGRSRLLFSRSPDRGAKWSEPVLLDGSVPKDSIQFQPAIAVNAEGVVGISWYDTRDAAGGDRFHEYFTASTDGGTTFLPSVRLSSAPSTFTGAGNMRMDSMVFDYKGENYLNFVSAVGRWPGGGDYMGLAVDRDGAFHPFWADSRTGTFQVYTASVSVERPAAKGASKAAAAPGVAARQRRPLGNRVELVFDPTRWDSAAKELEIPVRLRNASSEPIFGPITMEVLGFGIDDPELPKEEMPDPVVVNAANAKSGVGAVFDFGNALGSGDALEPDGLTAPVTVRLRFEDPLKVPPIRFRVDGMLEEPGGAPREAASR
jgi:hypothetical protein